MIRLFTDAWQVRVDDYQGFSKIVARRLMRREKERSGDIPLNSVFP
ncbi:MAG: hypothetical protein M3Z24_05965 [Chloroflexota bacterium]|nr:hypothetical protein [Chloroflexota bacterium]